MAALDQTQVKEGVDQETVDAVREVGGTYKYGWETEIEMEYAPKGLTSDIVRLISEKNDEPEWMTQWRLKAYERWLTKEEPDWAMVDYPEIDLRVLNRWKRSPNRWTRSIRSCSPPMRSWGSLSKNR